MRGFEVPKDWPKQLKLRWKVEVGFGHASPAVAGDRAFVLSRHDDKEVVRGLRLLVIGRPAGVERSSPSSIATDMLSGVFIAADARMHFDPGIVAMIRDRLRIPLGRWAGK